MPEVICSAHMHPLPCPGTGCRTTSTDLFISAVREYRADVAAGRRPPWTYELRFALQSARAWLRCEQGDEHYAGRTRGQAEARIADLRRAGWTGDDDTIWTAAASMARFTGAMPWHPQRACEEREVRYWREPRERADE